MAVTFPVTDLFTRFNLRTTSFAPAFVQSVSRNRAGSMKVYDMGRPIWKAAYVSVAMTHDDCIEIEAALNSMIGAVGTFYARDTRRDLPRAYPTGVFTDTSTVASIGGDGSSLALQGLPANFKISAGDYFRITVSGQPYIFQAQESVTASAGGVSAAFACMSGYHPAITVGAAVRFKYPYCLMRIEPGSVQFNDNGNILGTVAFNASEA